MRTVQALHWLKDTLPTDRILRRISAMLADRRHGKKLRDDLRAGLASFILAPGKGWRLSEAFDMNPVSGSFGLTLNIGETDNSLDLDLVRSVAPVFRLKTKTADELIESSQAVVRQWRKIAGRLGLSARACDLMAPAFRLAG